jgi:predicted anti-sigma-YlaC factor YlaD
MPGLTHQQAKRLINAAADHNLNARDTTALDLHLSQCSTCRAYSQEMNWLTGAIGRALRAKWSAPRRSPIDMSARVRYQLRAQSEQKFFLKAANFTVKIGSLALVVMLAMGIFRVHGPSDKTAVVSGPATSLHSSLPSFELESDSNSLTIISDTTASGSERWDLPSLPLNRTRASQY